MVVVHSARGLPPRSEPVYVGWIWVSKKRYLVHGLRNARDAYLALYGEFALKAFFGKLYDAGKRYEGIYHHGPCLYRMGKAGVEINPVVEQTMAFALESDPACHIETALAKVFKLLRDKILVFEEVRAGAREISETLQDILEEGKGNGRFWYSGVDRTGIWLDMGHIIEVAGFVSGQTADLEQREKLLGTTFVPLQNELLRAAQLDRTHFTIDKEFANRVVTTIDTAGLIPESTKESSLCFRCKELDIAGASFHIHDSDTDQPNPRPSCEFCSLRWAARHSLHLNKYQGEEVRMMNSMLYLDDFSAPVLSVCRSPGTLSSLAVS